MAHQQIAQGASLCFASFDVFDTLLTRTYATPCDLFLALGTEVNRRGLLDIRPEDLASRRVVAESTARQTASGGEPDLAEIYAVLGQDLGLSWTQADKLLGLELELEEAAIRPVSGMLRRVAAARNHFDFVFFLSDMYLPRGFVEGLLVRHGFFRMGDVLYLSGQEKVSKANGKLFAQVLAQRGSPTEWVHVGDNALADHTVPENLGIGTQPLKETRLSRYELLARGDAEWPPLWRSHLAGAMRLARLECPEASGPVSVIWKTGSDVVGPLLFSFVYWCLQQAPARGLRRLYFIARDGQVLHQIGKQICSAWGFPIECRYLYGSRQAFRIPAFTGIGKEELEWLLPANHDLTVEHVFARLGLPASQVQTLLSENELNPEIWHLPLSDAQLRNLGELLRREEIQRLVRVTAERARDNLVQYLDQEGFFEGVPFGLVDIGWQGNLQRSLSRCLNLTGHEKEAELTGFYLGLYSSVFVPKDQVLLDYWSQLNELGRDLSRQNITIFEAFAAADHGSTTSYEKQDGRVFPLLATAHNSEGLEWGVRHLQAAILAFCSSFASLVTMPPLSGLQWVTRRIFEQFYFKPNRDEAQVWGRFPLKGQPIENMRGQIVPQYQSERQVLAALLDDRKRPTGWWMEGSLAVKPSPSLFLFLKLRRLRWFARVLAHRFAPG